MIAQLAAEPIPVASPSIPPMAEKEKAAEEEVEYESDLDDAPLQAVSRRAAASDDDEEDVGGGGGGGTGSPPTSRVVGSDSDYDGQGAAEVYGDVEGSEKCEEAYEELDGGGGGGEAKQVADEVVAAPEAEGKYEKEKVAGAEVEAEAVVEGEDQEKKGSEHYAVPRTGAFYMHDDRSQDKENGSHGGQREFFGGQKLWYPKDDNVWVHDRFNEMNIHENARRRSMGPFRAWDRGRTHAVDHGCSKGTKSQPYYHDNSKDYKYVPKESRTRYDSTKNYNRFPREPKTSYGNVKNYISVPRKFRTYYDDKNFDNVRRESRTYYGNAKGYNNNALNVYRKRASRPYQPHWKNTFGTSSVQNNRTYSRSQNEVAFSNADVRKYSSQTLRLQHERTLPWKQTSASNLNPASPPFYSPISLHQELPYVQRRKAWPGIFTKLFSSSVRMALKPQSRPVFRVKAFVPSGGHGNAADSLRTVTIEGMPSPISYSFVSTSNNYSQYSKPRDQGRGSNIVEPTENKFSSTTSQVTRYYTQSNSAVYQQKSVEQSVQATPRVSTQTFRPKSATANKIQSFPQTTLTSSTKDAETSTPPGSNNSVASSAVKGQNGKEEAESACLPYGGGHVLGVTGASGLTLGGPNFTGTPALLPVTQFSGHHPRGVGIPSIGMALPGFVAQQEPGCNSQMSQMTWLPVLAGATRALGTTYNPPYFGSYYPQPSELASSSVSPSPRDHNLTKVLISLTPQEMPEIVVGHEHGQCKNKSRRYSEMNFARDNEFGDDDN